MANPLEIPIIPISQTYAPNTNTPRDLSVTRPTYAGPGGASGGGGGGGGIGDIMGLLGGMSGAKGANAKQDMLDAQGAPVTAPSQDFGAMGDDELTNLARAQGIM